MCILITTGSYSYRYDLKKNILVLTLYLLSYKVSLKDYEIGIFYILLG